MRYRLFLLFLMTAVVSGAGPIGPVGGRFAPETTIIRNSLPESTGPVLG